MSRTFKATSGPVAVTAQQDLFELTPADESKVTLIAVYVTQTTEVGDAEEEQLDVLIRRGHSTSGSGGSAGTEEPVDPDGAAPTAAIEFNNTTIASAGTTEDLHREAFNNRVGLRYVPVDEERDICTQAESTIVGRLLTTPADSVTMIVTVVWKEG